jgi:hypothetical protein
MTQQSTAKLQRPDTQGQELSFLDQRKQLVQPLRLRKPEHELNRIKRTVSTIQKSTLIM